MARKPAKKPAKKPAPKKSESKKSAPKKPAPKKSAKSKKPSTASGGGTSGARVTTGAGANPEIIGRSLVEMFNAGQFKQIEDKWWASAIESIEGFGMAWKGRHAVEAKNAGWMSQNTIHGASAEGPFVGATGFSVKFRMEVEDKASGKRTIMDEVGVYTVQNGKITREEFMYGAARPA